ncbi:MAG: hypothetical protein WD206_05135 [Actinomycetota bacterium]
MSDEHEPDTDFVHVFDASTQPLGDVAKSRLEAEGIPVIAKELGQMYPVGAIQLWVPADREAEARALFEDLGAGDLEVDQD